MQEWAGLSFTIDEEKKTEFTTSQATYTWDWDTRSYCRWGAHPESYCYDNLDNTQSTQITVQLSYTPPAAPTITSPTEGTITKQTPTTVSGTADPLCDMEILVNNISVSAGSCRSDAKGVFTCTGIALAENTNRLTAKASDGIQTSEESSPIQVILDTVPLTPTITIDQGDYTDNPAITLSITCNNATMMMLSESQSFTNALWQTYQPIYSWALSAGNGQKTIYAKFKKDYGFESQVASDTIILETDGPQVTITQPANGATIIGNGQSSVSIASALPMQKVEFYLDDTVQYTDTASPYAWSFSSNSFTDGLHTLKVIAVDTLGRSRHSTDTDHNRRYRGSACCAGA